MNETPARLETAFGVPLETLMRMENSFDIAPAHRRESEIIAPRYEARTENSQP